MVFFFIGYLVAIVLWLFPVSVSAVGFWENENGRRNFLLKVSFFEKSFEKRENRRSKSSSKAKKTFKNHLLKKIKPTDVPLSLLKEIRLSVTLPENKYEGTAIFLSMLGAITSVLPIKISVYRGKKTYWEIFVKASVSLYNIIPILLRKLIKGENNKWK